MMVDELSSSMPISTAGSSMLARGGAAGRRLIGLEPGEQRAEFDTVVVLERDGSVDPLSVDERAVAAAEVLQKDV